MNAVLIDNDAHFSAGLNALAQTVEGTSLVVIRQISETVDSLTAIKAIVGAVTNLSRIATKSIQDRPVEAGVFLDSNGMVVSAMKRSYDALADTLPHMLMKKSSIDADARLNEDHCDLLHCAYDEAIDSIAELIEAVKDLRAAVITHDLAAESRDALETYDSMDALTASLRVAA